MRLLASLTVLALLQLACVMSAAQIPTLTPTAAPVSPTIPATLPPTAAPSVTATDEAETAVIQATVWVRLSDNSESERIGSLTTGDRVEIVECNGQWCQVRAGELSGYVWRGCTDNNPDNLLCEAKP